MHIDYKNNKQDDKREAKREKKFYTNYDIFQGKVRLVEDGKPPKIIERDDAIEQAKSLGMDLVQIAYNKADFPHSICKIYNFNKFRYEQQKKEKLAKKQAKANEADVKEVCFSIRIDDNDFNVKVNHSIEWLKSGDKVKIIVKLLYRETHLTDFAKDTMKRVLNALDEYAELDSMPSATGRILSCIVRPKRLMMSSMQ